MFSGSYENVITWGRYDDLGCRHEFLWQHLLRANPTGTQQQHSHSAPLALTNDMWFVHLSKFIYDKEVTMVELMAVSVLSTSMLSYHPDNPG